MDRGTPKSRYSTERTKLSMSYTPVHYDVDV
jgi:hypothetical protein